MDLLGSLLQSIAELALCGTIFKGMSVLEERHGLGK